MTNYRFTFEINGNATIPSKNLTEVHNEMEKYLRTVVIPVGSPLESRYGVRVTAAMEEVEYAIHKHDGSSRCGGCRQMAEDGRS